MKTKLFGSAIILCFVLIEVNGRRNNAVQRIDNKKKNNFKGIILDGQCGDNLTWTFSGDTLAIHGTGDMTNFNHSSDVPWIGLDVGIVTIDEGVTSICDYAFPFSDLGEVSLPSSLISIGRGAFEGCHRLMSITIPSGVKSIGDNAFDNCWSLESINVDSNNLYFKSIDGVLFNNDCSLLIRYPQLKDDKSYTIPSGVLLLANFAFLGCSVLTNLTIPSSVTSIGDDIFDDCNNLASIDVDPDNENYKSIDGVLFNKNCSLLIDYPIAKNNKSYTIPSSVTAIGYGAFEGCKSLTNVVLGDNVNSIEDYAFNGCDHLTDIAMPSSLTSIGDYAFNGCGLKQITIPSSVVSIRDYAFDDCNSLASIDVDSNNENYKSIDGVLFNKNCTVLIELPSAKTDKTYIIPSSVISIGCGAFDNCNSLTNVILGDGVISIKENAFHGCNQLTSIAMPSGIESIGAGAFSGTGLKQVTIPSSVRAIGNFAFDECSNLASIDIDPDNKCYKSIDGVMFNKDCTLLALYPPAKADRSYVIPSSVVSIKQRAFSGCKNLTNITIGDSVSSIGESAFQGCDHLMSIIIPDSVKSIEDGAFSECYNLESVVFGEEVAIIGQNAFNACSSLASIFYQGTKVVSNYGIFTNCNSIEKICVSPDYNSTEFSNMSVTSNNSICQEFRSMFNHCFKPTYIDGQFLEQKRKNATIFESEIVECGQKKCYNSTGGKTDLAMCTKYVVIIVCVSLFIALALVVTIVMAFKLAAKPSDTNEEKTPLNQKPMVKPKDKDGDF